MSDLKFEKNELGASPEHSKRNGFAFGFFGEYSLSKKVALSVELQFSAEGSKEKYDQIAQEDGYSPESLRLDFIQLPVMAKLKLSNNLSLGVGPQLGLKVYAYEDSYRNFNFSGIVGLEYMISNKFFIDARYSQGFTNIYDDIVGVKATNSNIQVGLGFKL